MRKFFLSPSLFSDSFLEAIDEFDREEQKQYIIPIAITDSGKPSCKGVSNLTIIIGDENDNPMKMGSSSVFVYYFEVMMVLLLFNY